MSYIRTKDGRIVDTTKYPEHPASWSVQASDYALTIKESEILEELCDKFVTLSKYSNRHYEYLTLKGAINMRKKLPYEVCEIYGAIWTDKGLIYVAKMDSEGKLVLI